MTWVNIALLLLQTAASLISWLREKNQLDAGRDQEIAKTTAAILVQTQSARDVMAQVTGFSDEQVDTMLKGLEP